MLFFWGKSFQALSLQDRVSAFTFLYRKTTIIWKNFNREGASNLRFAGEEGFSIKPCFSLCAFGALVVIVLQNISGLKPILVG
jgi:hypothetical protein